LRKANGYTKCGPYLLASSLAAALLNGIAFDLSVTGESSVGSLPGNLGQRSA
jgi:hypothetical protein